MNNQQAIVKSFNTILEMLKDRNVNVTSINSTAIENVLVTSSLSNIAFKVQVEHIVLLYYLSCKFRWLDMKKIVEESMDPKLLYIFIVNDKISLNNMKSINSLGLNYQIFNIKELQFNITKHNIVPKHTLVDDARVKLLLETFSLKHKFQLPIILKSDPMSRYLGLKCGDVVMITRNSPSSGEYYVYRCCM